MPIKGLCRNSGFNYAMFYMCRTKDGLRHLPGQDDCVGLANGLQRGQAALIWSA